MWTLYRLIKNPLFFVVFYLFFLLFVHVQTLSNWINDESFSLCVMYKSIKIKFIPFYYFCINTSKLYSDVLNEISNPFLLFFFYFYLITWNYIVILFSNDNLKCLRFASFNLFICASWNKSTHFKTLLFFLI